MTAPLSLYAPAKVNLFLHVLRRREDGYHDLESLIVFVDTGDRLTVSPGPEFTLTIRGPFSGALAHEPVTDNLVYRAGLELIERAGAAPRGAHLELEKNLPVAAGLGGGSADAAASLRVLMTAWDLALPQAELEALALSLGADVPVCLTCRPSFVGGVGEIMTDTPRLPPLWAVLVNSGTPVPTGRVFKGLDPEALAGVPGPDVAAAAFGDREAFIAALEKTRNDLEPSALRVAPDIAEVLEALAAEDGCLLARMSGSGGTCFGLFASAVEAEGARARLASRHPAWWAEAGAVLQDAPDIRAATSERTTAAGG